MNAEKLFPELQGKQIHLTYTDGTIQIRGPKDVMTSELSDFFKEKKQTLIRMFEENDFQLHAHAECCDCNSCIGEDPDLSFPFGANIQDDTFETIGEALNAFRDTFGPLEDVTKEFGKPMHEPKKR